MTTDSTSASEASARTTTMIKWTVIETPCYPASWKVTFFGPFGEQGSNATSNFFRSAAAAWAEAARRNQR